MSQQTQPHASSSQATASLQITQPVLLPQPSLINTSQQPSTASISQQAPLPFPSQPSSTNTSSQQIGAGGYNYAHAGYSVASVVPQGFDASGHQQVKLIDRPHKCDVCDAAFSRSHDLKRHKRLHDGIKPYVCPHCQRAFSRQDALGRHLKTDNPSYPCCGLNTRRSVSRGRGTVVSIAGVSVAASVHAQPQGHVHVATGNMPTTTTTTLATTTTTTMPAPLSTHPSATSLDHRPSISSDPGANSLIVQHNPLSPDQSPTPTSAPPYQVANYTNANSGRSGSQVSVMSSTSAMSSEGLSPNSPNSMVHGSNNQPPPPHSTQQPATLNKPIVLPVRRTSQAPSALRVAATNILEININELQNELRAEREMRKALEERVKELEIEKGLLLRIIEGSAMNTTIHSNMDTGLGSMPSTMNTTSTSTMATPTTVASIPPSNGIASTINPALPSTTMANFSSHTSKMNHIANSRTGTNGSFIAGMNNMDVVEDEDEVSDSVDQSGGTNDGGAKRMSVDVTL